MLAPLLVSAPLPLTTPLSVILLAVAMVEAADTAIALSTVAVVLLLKVPPAKVTVPLAR
ncbi:hypothetical protein D3C84_203150 [compost metagenome]